jgi:actin-related protein 7
MAHRRRAATGKTSFPTTIPHPSPLAHLDHLPPLQVTPSAARVPDSTSPVPAIRRGEIVNWEVLESVLHYALYDQLPWIEGAEGPVMMVEPALTPRRDRERLIQLMFEVFNVNGYFATDAAVASLAAVGRLGGTVVDVGYEKTDVIPVLDGLTQASAAVRLPYGGRQITEHMQTLLQARGYTVELKEAEKAKLTAMRAADSSAGVPPAAATAPGGGAAAAAGEGGTDAAAGAGAGEGPSGAAPMETDNGGAYRVTYTLPDGQSIGVVEEGRALVAAVLNPAAALGLTLPTLAEAVQTAGLVTTLHGEKESRKVLAENILVCGGGAGATALPARLLSQVAALAVPALPPALVSIPGYLPKRAAQQAAWNGGAIIARYVFGGTGVNALSQPITRSDYNEMGPAYVHRKCS